jgi:hypothetical protein
VRQWLAPHLTNSPNPHASHHAPSLSPLGSPHTTQKKKHVNRPHTPITAQPQTSNPKQPNPTNKPPKVIQLKMQEHPPPSPAPPPPQTQNHQPEKYPTRMQIADPSRPPLPRRASPSKTSACTPDEGVRGTPTFSPALSEANVPKTVGGGLGWLAHSTTHLKTT